VTNYANDLLTLALPTTAVPGTADGATANVVLTLPGVTGTTPLTVGAVNGQWEIQVTPTAPGVITAVWTVGASTVTTTEVVAQRYDLVTLADVRAVLRQRATDTQDDVMIENLIDAATGLIEDVTGILLPQTFTETYDGGVPGIYLMNGPVIEVLSVSEVIGTSVYTLAPYVPTSSNAWSYYFEPRTATLERRTVGGSTTCFAPGGSNVTVTYRAGVVDVPAAVRHAAKLLVKHLYDQTLPPTGQRARAEAEVDPLGFAIPGMVLEMLAPYRRIPGLA
jgi:uncharacterized phiE125 gp8 family phage protein